MSHSQENKMTSRPTPSALKRLSRMPYDLLFDPNYSRYTQSLVVLGEIVLCMLIIRFIRFTNIDWIAYMEQVEQVISGQRDYTLIKGETGPLVYPAGHVWIYSVLYYLTESGKNIRRAQYIFAGIYILTQALVFRIYSFNAKLPPYAFILMALSKRLHSVYTLRLFNDGLAMLFLYACILSLCHRNWRLACILYSLALSIKMNILLFLPAFGMIILSATGAKSTIVHATEALSVQLLLALPFLTHSYRSYLGRAFELSRSFLYVWTVNWRFVPEDIFLSKNFSVGLLVIHVSLLAVAFRQWTGRFGGFQKWVRGVTGSSFVQGALHSQARLVTPTFIVTSMFACNLIGMLCARSLHYQFYAWEAHQLVWLAWLVPSVPAVIRLAILAGIEAGWETFPSTTSSSISLVFSHALLVGLSLNQIDWQHL